MTGYVGIARLRRPAWRNTKVPPKTSADDGPDRLRAFATDALRRARAVLLDPVTTTCSDPVRKIQAATEAAQRVWRNEGGGKPIWCLLSEGSQRALLEHVLSGPGAAAPTTVERTIVAECVDRLLGSPGIEAWIEIGSCPPAVDVWRCNVDICGANGTIASLELVTLAEPEAAARHHVYVGSVPLDMMAELDGVMVQLNRLRRWTRGSIVPLRREPNDVHATLALPRGPRLGCKVGVSGDKRAMRVTDRLARPQTL